MPELPRKLPETGKWRALFRWLNQLRDYVYSLRPLQSLNTLTEVTATGVYRSAAGGAGKPGEDATLSFRDQWDPETSYIVGDFVTEGDESADGKVAHDSGTRVGLYRCILGIEGDPGNDPPAQDATHWEMWDNGHHARRVHKVSGEDRFIDIDAGRDDADDLHIRIHLNGTAGNGAILLSIKDLTDAATEGGLSTGETMIIRPRLTQGRNEETGLCEQCIILRSEWVEV